MNKSTLLILLLSLLCQGLLFSTKASATEHYIHGSVCHQQNAADASKLYYTGAGIRNVNATAKAIVCPITTDHGLGSGTFGSVFLDYKSSVAFACTLISFNDTGNAIGSKFVIVPAAVTGKSFEIGPVAVNSFSSHALQCNLPGNNATRIVGIETFF